MLDFQTFEAISGFVLKELRHEKGMAWVDFHEKSSSLDEVFLGKAKQRLYHVQSMLATVQGTKVFKAGNETI